MFSINLNLTQYIFSIHLNLTQSIYILNPSKSHPIHIKTEAVLLLLSKPIHTAVLRQTCSNLIKKTIDQKWDGELLGTLSKTF